MFGLFDNKNPSRADFNEINEAAKHPAMLMNYIKIKKSIPASDKLEDIQLNIEENRLKVVDCFNKIISDYSMDSVTDLESLLLGLTLDSRKGKHDPLYDDSLAFLVNADTINNICKIYYKEFPESDKLLEVVNHLAKIFPPAYIVIFGESMADTHRKIWPFLSNIFEHYKTHKGV